MGATLDGGRVTLRNMFNGQMGTNKPTLRQKFSHYSMTLSAMFTTLIKPNMLVICHKPGECKAPFENGL